MSTTVDSVLAQTYHNVEVLLVDDCSTDDTPMIARRYAAAHPSVRVIELPRNSGGPAKPRNVGIAEAKGEYIAFLDADDVWVPRKLARQITFMVAHELDFSSTHRYQIGKDGKHVSRPMRERALELFRPKGTVKALFAHNTITTSSAVVARRALGTHRFDEDPYLVAVEDLYLWLELLLGGLKYGLLKEELVAYRVLEQSITSRNNALRARTRRLYCYSKFLYKYPDPGLLRRFYFVNMLRFVSGTIEWAISGLRDRRTGGLPTLSGKKRRG